MDRYRQQGDPTNPPVPSDVNADSSGAQNSTTNSGNLDTNANMPVTGNTDRQATYCGGFTMIPPNASRRNEITSMAQKEEQDLQRFKESQRVTAVQHPPERLGGHVTEAEARQKQLHNLKQSYWQKKLKSEEMDKQRRQEKEQQFQKMKEEQRAKAERLNKKTRDEEQRREEELCQDHVSKNGLFLQRLESSSASSQTGFGAIRTPPDTRAVTKGLKEVQLDHKRVNAAFLDKLEGRGEEQRLQREEFGGSIGHSQSTRPSDWSRGLDPEPSRAEAADEGPEYELALAQLMSRFPDCSRGFLEDILEQCDSDYHRARELLDGSS